MRLDSRRKMRLGLRRVKDDHVYYFKDAREKLVLAVWEKGNSIPGKDKAVWRKDIVDKKIKYSEHGNTKSIYGWEIDHIKPTALKGTDDLRNLQPLYWRNNRKKGDTWRWPKTRLGIRI